MTDQTKPAESEMEQLDAVILGAGFAGLCQLRKLRDDLGLNARVYDKAGGVGGTWYWNRYPGARSDTESFVYEYSFDRELYEDWNWSDRYPKQPEILSYLEHVADRWNLHPNIRLNTKIEKVWWNEDSNRWNIQTDKGDWVSARWVVNGLGLLSAPYTPDLPGIDKFEGEIYHTSRWPHETIDFSDKRVGVIGVGSTGVQVISELGSQVKEMTVFLRRPQYSVPARHGPLPKEEVEAILDDYDGYFEKVRRSATCFGFEESTTSYDDVSPEEREAIFEKGWEKGGGFAFMFGTFNDIAVNEEANEAAAEFIRKKIRETVKDPKKAELLQPRDYYARRPLCDPGYFETFNRDNVHIANVRDYPIKDFDGKKVITDEGEFEIDILIFATGFDSVTGNHVRIDFRGRNGVELKDKWADGPRAYFGLCVPGFPNMFSIYGPPGPFTNQPPAIEWQCQWVAETIDHVNNSKNTTIEATDQAERAYLDECIEIAESTLFAKLDWWVMGTNIPGKPRAVSFYMGGMGNYIDKLESATANNYEGFELAGEEKPALQDA